MANITYTDKVENSGATAEGRLSAADANEIKTVVNGKQDSDSDLTAIAGLAPSNDDILQRKAGAWTNRTVAQVKTDLALNNVDNTSDANKQAATISAIRNGVPTGGDDLNKLYNLIDAGLADANAYTDTKVAAVSAGTYIITTADNPQTIFDAAPAGSKFFFMEGVHESGFNNSKRSILYVDKACRIELHAEATLKLADNTTTLELTNPEITTNQGVAKSIDDLAMGGTSNYNGSKGKVDYYVQIATIGATDTFVFGTFDEITQIYTPIGTFNCTTTEQAVGDGVKIMFGATTGHTLSSIWFISYDGRESYGIRIADGFNATAIENVVITGTGTIDLNEENNIQPSFLVPDISSCVLVHGNVKNIIIEQLILKGAERKVMAYGDSDGTYLNGGDVTGATINTTVDGITVRDIKVDDPSPLGRGFLFGHPSHRGFVKNLKCYSNYIYCRKTAIEPNFNLIGYYVENNIIEGISDSVAIHCWRHSANGIVRNNVVLNAPDAAAVLINAPGGWNSSVNVVESNNSISIGSGDDVLSQADAITALLPISYHKFNTNMKNNVGQNMSSLITTKVCVIPECNDNRNGWIPAEVATQAGYDSTENAIKWVGAQAVYRLRKCLVSPQVFSIALSFKATDITTSQTLWSYRSSTTELIQLTIQSGTVIFQFRGSGNVMTTLTKSITINTKHTVVATFDRLNDSFNLYLDSNVSPATSNYDLGVQTLNASVLCLMGFTSNGTTFTKQGAGTMLMYKHGIFPRVLNTTDVATVMSNF